MSKEDSNRAILAGATAQLDREDHLADRLDRVLTLADRWIGPGPAADALAIASLRGAQRDGSSAVAGRLSTILRHESTPAVDVADRPEHTGSLGAQTLSADSTTTRAQATVRSAIRASDALADTALSCERLIDRMSPGGDIWNLARSRSQKRALRDRIRIARRLMRSGEIRAARSAL